jgi:CBS domain-containing protein
MFGLPIGSVMERKKVLMAPPETTIVDAAKLMAKKKVGAVLVVEDGRLVGIFTERDAVYRVIAKGRDPSSTTLAADVMTPDPNTVTPKESFGYAMLLMHEHGFRHAPVVENNQPIGIVSARMALDPELEEFEAEARRRKSIRRHA